MTAEATAISEPDKKRAKRSSDSDFVDKVNVPGRYGDGGWIYLIVDLSSLNGRFSCSKARRRRDVGLGSAETVSLEDARVRRLATQKAKAGHDPVAVRSADRVGVPTFEDAARKVHAEYLKKWRQDSKSSVQWLTILERYAFPLSAIGL